MPFLPKLPKKTNLADVIKAFPKGWEDMLDYHDVILRGDSPFTIAERELISAYVSGLNECRFCLNAHTVYAESFGVPEETVAAMLDDLEIAPVDEKMRPVLSYARKLTLSPGTIEKSDVTAMLDAGWTEEAVADANIITALYNFMNRVIIGMGVDPFDDFYGRRLQSVRKQPLHERQEANQKELNTQTYRAYGKSLGIIKQE